jgi:4-hydroxythreonine-4-phosphate dehydrogenase
VNTEDAPTLALTLGDPAGIGPEITARLLARADLPARLLVVGAASALERAAVLVGVAVPPGVDEPATLADLPEGVGRWRGAEPLSALPAYGTIDARGGAACHAWVLQAAALALAGEVDGIVTGPIHKAAWHAAGVTSPGHTEALAALAGSARVLMMLQGDLLRVVLATIHVPLREVPGRLETAGLAEDLRLLDASLRGWFGMQRPRIAVCGLNPHAGEEGLFGSEDAAVIAPAVAAARARGIDAIGPLPADACIPAGAAGAYDAVFAMYHDQALPAVKSVAPRRCVNVTLGLPFVRTSVDHGTAFDIAGSGRATEESLFTAVALAAQMCRRRIPAGEALNPTRPPSDLS